MRVKTIAWMINPNVVGHPELLQIGPTKPDNNVFTNLYVQGLKRMRTTRVV